MSFILLIIIITVFSIVQSILGVGLLVFGTPTLLLLGYSFFETLSIVLPASITVSLLQILESNTSDKKFRREFNMYCLPFVFAGLVLATFIINNINFHLIVGLMLLTSALLRLSQKLNRHLSKIIYKYRKPYQIFMGTIHGLTNMGGGFLTLYSSSVHDKDKMRTCAGIAYGYLYMGVIQYTMLLLFDTGLLSVKVITFILVAALSYLLFGKRLFHITHEKIFHHLITITILIYGIILVVP